MHMESTIKEMAKAARIASRKMAGCSLVKKNEALLKIAGKIEKKSSYIKKENQNHQLFGGKLSLIIIALFAVFVLIIQIISQLLKAFS